MLPVQVGPELWVPTITNPGLYIRGRYGPGYLYHVQSWRHAGRGFYNFLKKILDPPACGSAYFDFRLTHPKRTLHYLPGFQTPRRNHSSDILLDTYEWKQTKIWMIFKMKCGGVLILKCVVLFHFNHNLILCLYLMVSFFLSTG